MPPFREQNKVPDFFVDEPEQNVPDFFTKSSSKTDTKPVIKTEEKPVVKTETKQTLKPDVFGKEPEHEPETWWGGFKKSIKDQILGATAGNEMLQGAAHPQTTGDFLSLLVPSELPNLRNFIPGTRSKLPQIAKSIR